MWDICLELDHSAEIPISSRLYSILSKALYPIIAKISKKVRKAIKRAFLLIFLGKVRSLVELIIFL